MNQSKKYNKEYDHHSRWMSYWHQIKNIFDLEPNSIVEIGVGSGVLSEYLKKRDFNIFTLDIDNFLKPDMVCDISSQYIDGIYSDVVCAFQVLEHINLNKIETALDNICRMSKKNVVISLPQNVFSFKFYFKIPLFKSFKLLLIIPKLRKNRYFQKNGHYWEIGNIGTSKKWLIKSFKKRGFELVKSYTVFENSYHVFFVFKKI
ncbi:class I SAM-dependent methyltransferase [Patescibacteria group bacterium]|nr:class I SAM-dependent methyltransferase [Patescibacteria group bacterium]